MTGLRALSDPLVVSCVATRGHTYRPRQHSEGQESLTVWACISCHVRACGTRDDPDPCFRAYGHDEGHVSQMGVRWPQGRAHPAVRQALALATPTREAVRQIRAVLDGLDETGDAS